MSGLRPLPDTYGPLVMCWAESPSSSSLANASSAATNLARLPGLRLTSIVLLMTQLVLTLTMIQHSLSILSKRADRIPGTLPDLAHQTLPPRSRTWRR